MITLLACAPASPVGQDGGSEEPTATPYPEGYVKPTDEPTWNGIRIPTVCYHSGAYGIPFNSSAPDTRRYDHAAPWQ